MYSAASELVSATSGKTVVHAPGGGFATIEPSKANFNKKVAKVHKITDQQLLAQAPAHLKCPVSNKLLDNAVMLPCCHQSVDDERMRQVLINNEFVCPLCKASRITLDKVSCVCIVLWFIARAFYAIKL